MRDREHSKRKASDARSRAVSQKSAAGVRRKRVEAVRRESLLTTPPLYVEPHLSQRWLTVALCSWHADVTAQTPASTHDFAALAENSPCEHRTALKGTPVVVLTKLWVLYLTLGSARVRISDPHLLSIKLFANSRDRELQGRHPRGGETEGGQVTFAQRFSGTVCLWL